MREDAVFARRSTVTVPFCVTKVILTNLGPKPNKNGMSQPSGAKQTLHSPKAEQKPDNKELKGFLQKAEALKSFSAAGQFKLERDGSGEKNPCTLNYV